MNFTSPLNEVKTLKIGVVEGVILFWGRKKKGPNSWQAPNKQRRLGLDSSDLSTRDVFNDVSKYIGTISMSLNSVFP
jgi:hypothetical protein